MNRRACLALMASAFALRAGAEIPPSLLAISDELHPLQESWAAWKALCLMSDGRVVDGFQGGASHSEGQGYGLVLAALFGDAATCRAVIGWTEHHLAVREDALLAWRWRPEASPQITDRNNASDGDLFYAWGLVLAAELTDEPAFRQRAVAIAQDLARTCLAEHPDGSGRLLFLPAATGFARDEGLVVNPSYYMPLAMTQLGAATGVARLGQAARDGVLLVDALGAGGPVPDWVLIDAAGPRPAPRDFSPVSGYEAMRVPLFALWSGQDQSPAVRAFIAATADRDDRGIPTVIDLETGAVLERSPHSGYAAVAQLARCAAEGGVGSLMPRFDSRQPYYPATLHLMALVAQISTYPRCVPI
ncbi:glycosyl hydrolase family 8 [Plastorhodobacter daqingensis]|uniref:cellulase n=1 Tax=Plastorhodobacter daqingensis TaxID=1387281 RepID=A0ABW2UIQ3_9RHOB